MRFKIDKLFYIILTIAIVFLVFSLQLFAQTLRYSNHRDLSIPDYATLHLGPFFSDISFMQSAGYRYVRSSGVGVDFLKNNKRGIYKEDGYDFPLISKLNFRNYLLISQRMDMDLSISVNYEHYPRHTQEDVFAIILPEEGILGDLSFMFQPTPFAKITLYDNFVYKTDYIDTRGITDLYGGSEYEYFKNTVGLDSDWLIAEDQNVGISLSQTDNMPKDDSFKMQEYVSYAESILYEKRITSFLITGAKASFSQAYYAVSNRPNASAGEYLIYSKVQLTQQTEGGGQYRLFRDFRRGGR